MALEFPADGNLESSANSAYNMSSGSTIMGFTGWINGNSVAWAPGTIFQVSDGVDGWAMEARSTGDILVYTIGSNTGNLNVNMDTTSWYHVMTCFNQSATNMQVYVNNTSYYDANYTDTSASTNPDFVLGSNSAGGSPWGNHVMAGVAMFSIQPTANQIAALANAQDPRSVLGDSNIIDYHHMIGGRYDGVKGTSMTATETTGSFAKFDHPRMHHRKVNNVIPFPTAAVAGATGKSNPMYGPLGGPLVGVIG